MTNNNAKTVLMMAIIFSIVIPITGFSLVSGQIDDKTTISQGKTLIQPDFVTKVKEDRSELIALDEAYGKASTDKEREAIKAAADEIMQKDRPSVDELQKGANYMEIKDELVASITSMPKIGEHFAIPFTGVGYDRDSASLEIRIHQDFATMENMKNYEKTIRSIVGDDVDLKISNGGEYSQLATCPTGPLDDCDPLESGIEYQVTNHSGCTVGMRATYDGDDGFVSAGHCADGEKDSDVGQDSISSVIGTVSKETFNQGSSYETCDCTFIEIDSGSRSMDADVYWDTYYPTSAADASVNDYVKIYGKSGKTYAYVDFTCDDENAGGTVLKCVVQVDNAAAFGDSGGMVVQTFDSSPEFHGILAAVNHGLDQSWYVKHGKFTSHFSGLSWDY